MIERKPVHRGELTQAYRNVERRRHKEKMMEITENQRLSEIIGKRKLLDEDVKTNDTVCVCVRVFQAVLFSNKQPVLRSNEGKIWP